MINDAIDNNHIMEYTYAIKKMISNTLVSTVDIPGGFEDTTVQFIINNIPKNISVFTTTTSSKEGYITVNYINNDDTYNIRNGIVKVLVDLLNFYCTNPGMCNALRYYDVSKNKEILDIFCKLIKNENRAMMLVATIFQIMNISSNRIDNVETNQEVNAYRIVLY